MEYLKGGELYSYWKRFSNKQVPECEARSIFKQLITAIEYCHSKKIIHRDLKLQNILLQEVVNELPTNNEVSKNRVKVVDFGIFGSNMGSIAEKSNCGSLKFMAPELLQGRTESTPKIDVWSMGIILYALVFGEYPFHDRDKEQLKK